MSDYKFSEISKKRLETCHPRLQELCNEAIKIIDIGIVCGHRSKESQDECFKNGTSKVQWPNGKHNKLPSMAVDIMPYPLQPLKLKQTQFSPFYFLAGIIKALAFQKGLKLRWGGDWDGDNDFTDNKFQDLFHFELEEEN